MGGRWEESRWEMRSSIPCIGNRVCNGKAAWKRWCVWGIICTSMKLQQKVPKGTWWDNGWKGWWSRTQHPYKSHFELLGLQTWEKGCFVLLIKQMPGALRSGWKRENERERKGFELHFIFYTVFTVSFNSVTNSSSCLMWGYVVFFQVQCFPDTSWLNFRYSENETVLLLFNTKSETATSTCSLLLLSTKQTQSYNSVNLTQHGGITKHNFPWALLP